MKPTVTETIENEDALRARLIELSRTKGGAWASSAQPFSHETDFYQAKSPSKIPDWLYWEQQYPRTTPIAYKGKMVPFSVAAVEREQRPGTSR